MLVNPDFADHVGREIQATSVAVTPISKGLSAVFTLDSPDNARRILGPTLTLNETVTWEKRNDDGSRPGRLTITVAGMPASADGQLCLRSTPSGATLVYDSTFTVKIPLVGKRIEEMTAQYLTSIIAACEKVGNNWLANNRHP